MDINPLGQGTDGTGNAHAACPNWSLDAESVSPRHGACGRRAATAPFRQGGHCVGFRPGEKHHEGLPSGCRKASPEHGGKRVLALPVAEKARTLFPQRSKKTRKSVSPKCFSGTARWIGGPLCVPCGYAVDEVPGARIMDSIVLGQLGQGAVPCPMLQRRRGTVKCDPSFY